MKAKNWCSKHQRNHVERKHPSCVYPNDEVKAKKKVWVGYLATNKSGTMVYDFKENRCELEGMLHIFATIRKVRVEEL